MGEKEFKKYEVVKRCYPVANENYMEWGYVVVENIPEMVFKERKGFWVFKKEVEHHMPEEHKDVRSYGKPVIFRTKKEAEEFVKLTTK